MTVYADLARAIDTCSSLPWDGARRTTRERFERFFAHHEALAHCAIAAGIAAQHDERVRVEADPENVRYALDVLWGGLSDGLSYIGYDVGYFYGGQSWAELCVMRSAAEMIETLFDAHDPEMGAEVREVMETFAEEMFRPLDVPEGMPASHWWWRAPHPPHAPRD